MINLVRPLEVIQQVAEAVPVECRDNIVIIGSLAAAYAYFGNNDKMSVRTKDIDCMLKPFQLAVEKGQEISRKLLDAGWKPRQTDPSLFPGTTETPDDKLPAIRLYPPGMDPEDENAWFIELLTIPESSRDQGKKWLRVVINEGHFGLPSFRYLLIAAFEPVKIDQFGLYYAQPKMMALANMLEHPEIKPERMSALFADLEIKRSNKDLVEAHHTCANGLLSSYAVTQEELKEVGNRILGEAVETLEELAER